MGVRTQTADIPISRLIPSGKPLYQQVKQAVLGTLARGEWQQGEAIPPEKELAARFGVSIGTLRKAIDDLVAEDILTRHQGRGTFVTRHSRNQHYFKFFRIIGHDGKKAYPVVRLISFQRKIATADQRRALGLAARSEVFEFVNVLHLDDEPVSTDTIIIPESLFGGLTREHLENRPGTLYGLYQEAFGINIIDIAERLRAVLADAADSKHLLVQVGAPLLEIRRIAYSYNGQPTEFRISHVNSSRHEYQGSQHNEGV